MKKSIYLIFALLCLIGVYSCSDENIGSSITDTRSSIIEDSSFVMTGSSVLNSKVHAKTSTQLVGKVNSPGYGKITSDVVCQLMPAAVLDTSGVQEEWIDSCNLELCLNYSDGFTGDSLAPMRISVYELTKQLPEPIYSDFDPTGYYDPEKPLGSVSCSPASAIECSETYSSTTSTWKEVHVPMPISYVQSMWNLWKKDKSIFSDPEVFKKYYPGLYITTSYGSGRVMNYYATELETYYRQYTQLTDSTDTIYHNSQTYAASTPEVITNNNIKLEIDQKVKDMVANGDAIVMGPAGYEVNVKFPIQEIIDKYKLNTSDGLSLINSLEMTIPVEKVTNTYDIAPPQYILMCKKDKKDEFFAGDSLTNDEDSFYATYNSTDKCYEFSGMRDYILNIINNKGGYAEEEDINLVLTPIDVTTYTNTSTYLYYSYTTSSSVTKIAPAVAKPSIAKLRLDKAKIKIVYSKQSVF